MSGNRKRRAADESERQVTLAAVVGAHGVAGEVRLKLFTDSVEGLAGHEQLRVGDRLLTLKAIRPGKVPVARFEEIRDRDKAEALRGSLVTVARSALPPLEDGEYYHVDLIGLACHDAAGKSLGTVAAVENFGAGDILEIELPDGRRAMVPFREGVADLVAGRVLVDPIFLV